MSMYALFDNHSSSQTYVIVPCLQVVLYIILVKAIIMTVINVVAVAMYGMNS